MWIVSMRNQKRKWRFWSAIFFFDFSCWLQRPESGQRRRLQPKKQTSLTTWLTHLRQISDSSRIYLRFISDLSQIYLRFIWDLSQVYVKSIWYVYQIYPNLQTICMPSICIKCDLQNCPLLRRWIKTQATHVCVCACTCVRVYVCMCTYVCTCVRVYVCAWLYVCTCVRVYVCMCHTWTCVYTCLSSPSPLELTLQLDGIELDGIASNWNWIGLGWVGLSWVEMSWIKILLNCMKLRVVDIIAWAAQSLKPKWLRRKFQFNYFRFTKSNEESLRVQLGLSSHKSIPELIYANWNQTQMQIIPIIAN